jgi:hypothetical protein
MENHKHLLIYFLKDLEDSLTQLKEIFLENMQNIINKQLQINSISYRSKNYGNRAKMLKISR